MQTLQRHPRLQTLSSALLLAGLSGFGLALPDGAWAQAASTTLTPTPLITFTGDTGSFPGHGGRLPPVVGRHDATQARLFGVAEDGGRYLENNLTQKRAPSYFYALNLANPSDTFSSTPLAAYRGLMDNYMNLASLSYMTFSQFSLVEFQAGKFLAGLNQSGGTTMTAMNGGSAVQIDVSGSGTVIARAGTATAAKVLEVSLLNSNLKFISPRGIHAYDADGNAYFFANNSNSTGNANELLVQLNTKGEYRLVKDWKGLQVTNTYHGVFLVTDTARGKLYAGIGNVKGSKTSLRGQVVAFNVSDLASLASGQDVSPESTLLVDFLDAAYGVEKYGALLGLDTGQSSLSNQSAAVLDGDWLYGNSMLDINSGVLQGDESEKGVLWRLNLKTNALQRVHAFGIDASIANDGVRPYGPLVRGADGNIYGTTFLGGVSNGGTLFRIKVGDAEDRANDQYEQLASFADGAAGVAPTGLVAVPAQSAQGRLIGTTQFQSGNPALRMPTAQGYGTLYEVRYDLPPVEIRSFAASPASLTLGDGRGIALNWDVIGSGRDTPCVIRADSVDYAALASTSQAAFGSVTLDAPTREGDVTFTLECQTHIDGELITRTAAVAVAPTPAPEPVPEPEPGQNGGSEPSGSQDSGGGGGGLFGMALAMPLIGLALRRRRTVCG